MNLKSMRPEKGSVLIIAMILLVVLTFAASTSIMNSVTNIKIGANYSQTIGVFNLAELGIAKGKLLLKNTADFDTLLDTANYPGGVIIPTTYEEGGNYTVTIANNTYGANLDAGGAADDTDNIIILTSTAYGPKGNKVEIETFIGRPTFIDFPDAPPGTGGGAAGICGSGPNVDLSGNSLISGADWDVPADFDCSGAGCDGSYVDPNTGGYGLVLQSDANPGDQIKKKDESRMEGYCGGAIQEEACDWTVNSELDCESWENLSNQLAALGAGPNVQIINDDSISAGTLGTRVNPQVTIINTPSNEFRINGTVDGAGVIVVASNTSVTVTGTFHYEGVMIILGDNAQMATSGGSVDFFGYVIVNSSIVDLEPEIDAGGGAKYKYSTAAMTTAQQAIDGASGGSGSGSQLITLSWAERY